MSRYDLEDQLWAQLAAAAELPKHRQLGNLTAWRLRPSRRAWRSGSPWRSWC
jgi:hypothetical protein